MLGKKKNPRNFFAEQTELRNECEHTKGNFYSYGINIHACIYNIHNIYYTFI